MEKNKIGVIILTILIYVLSSGLSYALFSNSLKPVKKVESPLATSSKTNPEAKVFDQSLPKTEQCPLNGALYSKQQKEWWQTRRPLGVMIENHEEARPQSGLSSADVVYEAVAEGGITRFLAVYYCQDAGQIGPVRSARTYFLDFISEYGANPLYAHVGGANMPGPADALSQIESYGWEGYNDLNQFSIGFPTFWRDYDRLGRTVATEHTMYSTTTKLWDFVSKLRKLTNVDEEGNSWDEKFVNYTFKDDSSSKSPQSINLEFWKDYDKYYVNWIYDPASNIYKRKNAGKAHFDKDNNEQLAAKNVVILYMRESNVNDGYENNLHLLYGTKGSGKALVFIDGKEISGRWRKDGRTSRTILTDSEGNSIKFNRGLIWFEILPADAQVTVK